MSALISKKGVIKQESDHNVLGERYISEATKHYLYHFSVWTDFHKIIVIVKVSIYCIKAKKLSRTVQTCPSCSTIVGK